MLIQIVEGLDVTEILNIQKYEPPIPANLAGVVKGPWMSAIRKTDEERVQNLTNEWPELLKLRYEITEKLEGCLFEQSKISTSNGMIPIENLAVGLEIISFNHDTKLEESDEISGFLVRSEVTEWIKIELEDGSILKVTPNHPIFIEELHCYRRADQLEIGQNILQKTQK